MFVRLRSFFYLCLRKNKGRKNIIILRLYGYARLYRGTERRTTERGVIQ
ncbi:hypothetical protein BACUNI_02329 [Bacteroides uniformis ATCC 8492]|uniref:Uncharacterized protein n=1 Tax=Bacteroides uniformis (strain ATCC 8492 / DSM 6597 / CCUG 4942 / CIP 103695 / JCM 5828 / KCTC 5204 / NCTC 13054 / VPI 0061) TaxID=411479 RepID=A0ABC9NCF4_BACUC|nr:hypothetical protein BACUNI_02329 [Bacteroides uniformis ATCC 8492]